MELPLGKNTRSRKQLLVAKVLFLSLDNELIFKVSDISSIMFSNQMIKIRKQEQNKKINGVIQTKGINKGISSIRY